MHLRTIGSGRLGMRVAVFDSRNADNSLQTNPTIWSHSRDTLVEHANPSDLGEDSRHRAIHQISQLPLLAR